MGPKTDEFLGYSFQIDSSDQRIDISYLSDKYPMSAFKVPVYRRHQLPRRDFARPQSGSFYPHNFGNRKDPSTWSPWIPVRSFIDDKIEPPLSKTNTGDQ